MEEKNTIYSGRVKVKIKSEDNYVEIKTEIKNEDCSSRVKTEVKTEDIKPIWDPAEILARKLNLKALNVSRVIDMLDQGATIPFIARYRKEASGNMEPDTLREVFAGFEDLRAVESKMKSVYTSIEKTGKMTHDLDTSLKLSTTIHEIDSLYAPFKPGHKGTYSERAKALGLEPYAQNLLMGKWVCLSSAVNVNKKGLETVGDVETGVKHIIADIIAKDKEIMEEARNVCNKCNVMIESKKGKKASASKKKEKGDKPQVKINQENKQHQDSKFEQYFDFHASVRYIKPHQILALNRAEDLKVVTVKVVIPDEARIKFLNFVERRLLPRVQNPAGQVLVKQAILDAYSRLMEPMLCRHIWSDLTKEAEKASIQVFSSNLKNLLLAQPIKNKTILSIDPGFRNGCKCAVISPTSQVLWTGVAYLHCSPNNWAAQELIASTVKSYRCELITIGNGVACRETELIIAQMIKHGSFHPLNIQYCIVDECGASIYSVSEQAQKDLPDLDPTVRGAVSLARRIQDPLAELVKIEPKHLGVGMYQHDVNTSKLQTALNSVVEECVSFVGVDINTCSESLLQHVAGLNKTKAKNLLAWRAQNGFFTSRQQLLGIKGLGKKGFEQCAGFIRVAKPSVHSQAGNDPVGTVKEEVKNEVVKKEEDQELTNGRKRKTKAAGPSKKKKAKKEEAEEWNPLDTTSVHPESYALANRLASHLGVCVDDIGKPSFINQVKTRASDSALKSFSESENAGLATIQLIVEAFQQPLSHDLRQNFQKPLFRQGVKSMSDLHPGSVVTGRVTNTTPFGAFVDIGVGQDGLIHVSAMSGCRVSHGAHVKACVKSVDLGRNRIALTLINILNT